MNKESILDHKVGDTFKYDGKALDSDDQPVDLTNYTIKAQVRDLDNGKLVSDAVVTKPFATSGEYKITINNTNYWPSKMLVFDVQFSDQAGFVESTETLFINSQRDVTK